MDTVRQKTLDKYLFLDMVAVGGMAELYRAKMMGEQGFEKLVAVKKILPHLAEEKPLIEAFIDEAKLAALLQHKNIVQIYDFGRIGESYFISMEYLFGKDLHQLVHQATAKSGGLELKYALYIINQICSGLTYAHNLKNLNGEALNIIHRDISPHNIFITYDGQVKIIDFGIAKAASQNSKTKIGIIKGKAAYMSPEQATGRSIDHRTDIFAAGILLYEMCTGKRIFEGDTFHIISQLQQFNSTELLANVDIPSAIHDILVRALARDPSARYQSCAEMRKELEDYLFQNGLRIGNEDLAHLMANLFKKELAAETKEMTRVTHTDYSKNISTNAVIKLSEEPHEKTMALAADDHEHGQNKQSDKDNKNDIVVPSVLKPKQYLRFASFATIAAFLVLLGIYFVGGDSKPPEMEAAMEALENERFAEATDHFRTLLEKEPSWEPKVAEAFARALIGRADGIAKNEPEKAEKLLQRAIELSPTSMEGHYELAQLFLKKKDYSRAIIYYQKAAELDSKYAKTFFNLGYSYMKIHDYQAAKEMYQRVVKLSPPFTDEAYFNLAIAHEKLGEKDACLDSLKQALAVNPENHVVKQYIKKYNL